MSDRDPLPKDDDPTSLGETIATAYRRDRLLASLALMLGAAFLLAVPFALRAGAEFFLPVTTALVIAIALVPVLEWMERRRVPSGLAAFLCIILFLTVANMAMAAIVHPGERMGADAARASRPDPRTLGPLFEVLYGFRGVHRRSVQQFGRGPASPPRRLPSRRPIRCSDHRHVRALRDHPEFFAVLMIYFFLSG